MLARLYHISFQTSLDLHIHRIIIVCLILGQTAGTYDIVFVPFSTEFPLEGEIATKPWLIVFVTYQAKRDLMGIVKSIDSGQPAQADHGQNFLLLADFLCIK